ncbi:NFYB/HAP3 family transcription factor subunit [Candidatus Woesearchaeota archaeon]|nr:NFYB/HAP3 family transcription factor subunit [Candidatus Woesearchaeota archaeon]
MSTKRFLSLNAMDKIMRDAGAPRVSDDAKEALAQILEERGQQISAEAKRLAEHAGRKTVTDKDIRLAVK